MEFFGKIKTKIRVQSGLLSLLFIALAALFIFLGFMNGFSTEATMQIGPRGTDVGIPIPDWLLSSIFILLGGFFAFTAVTTLISAFKDKDYNKLIDQVKTVGDVAAVGNKLAGMEKNPFAKGDLRCDPTVLFYMKGTDANVVNPAHIKAIRPEAQKVKNEVTYYVVIYCDNTKVSIKATKKTVEFLAQDIVARLSGTYTQTPAAPAAQ